MPFRELAEQLVSAAPAVGRIIGTFHASNGRDGAWRFGVSLAVTPT